MEQNPNQTNQSPAASNAQEAAGLKGRTLSFYKRYESYVPAATFIGGFIFDVFTLSRIDDTWAILQQAIYLAVLAVLVLIEIEDDQRVVFGGALRGKLGKFWGYREFVIHFLFGSLLSVYTLFFFKSASFESSFVFMLLIAGLMVVNESERFQRLGPYMRLGLLSLCTTCFLCYLFPILFGFGGIIPFLLSLLIASGLVFGAYTILNRKPTERIERPLKKWVLYPGLGIQALFLLLYIFRLIPPVPLSAQYMGIYHQIEKKDGKYHLSYERPWWKVWEQGAQTFPARAGDRVYVFASVFAPRGFKDEIRVRWLYDDPKGGWQSSDSIPFTISGGRDAGFRGFAFKQNWQPGKWMVKLETVDGREISRIRFKIVPDKSDVEATREFDVDVH